MVHELLGITASDDPELRPEAGAAELIEMTDLASTRFEAGDYRAAADAYRKLLDRFPGDPVAKAMLGTPELMAGAATVPDEPKRTRSA
jgi:hypothetical protein